jgi:hypothetical protein
VTEEEVVAEREGSSVRVAGHGVGSVVGVHAHIGEIVREARFQQGAHAVLERSSIG